METKCTVYLLFRKPGASGSSCPFSPLPLTASVCAVTRHTTSAQGQHEVRNQTQHKSLAMFGGEREREREL